jgi:Curli production assembly/transport component CsgG.
MKQSMWVKVSLIMCAAFIVLQAFTQETVRVPLHYNYLPGEPYWAKYGSIDKRNIAVYGAPGSGNYFGKFLVDGSVQYTLNGESRMDEYLTDAVSAILGHFGVDIQSYGHYRLIVFPEMVRFESLDGEANGRKACRVVLRTRYYSGDTALLWCARVENSGSADIETSDALGFADLLDRTMHGAIVKLWGSQILYCKTPLGCGRVEKVDRGTYAFFPDTLMKADCSPKPGLVEEIMKKHNAQGPETDSIALSGADAKTVLAGNSGRDSVVVIKGHRITAGLLPFENATGREDCGAALKAAQEQFAEELGHAATIKIMERAKLNEILREQALGLSGAMNDSTVVKVGNITGLQVMVSAKLTIAGGYYRLSGRIINVETSAIVATASVLIPDGVQIEEAGPELAAKLLQKFTEEKLDINRNAMTTPAPLPQAIPAVAASCEDSWSVEDNPAAIMKVRHRDVAFYSSITGHLTGETPSGNTVSTDEPAYSYMGTNAALPLSSYLGMGFGVKHQYVYPQLAADADEVSYNYKEEETVLTLPLAVGVTPRLSFGINLNVHIDEYQVNETGETSVEGTGLSTGIMLGTLFQISQRFRMGVTYAVSNVSQDAQQKENSGDFFSIKNPQLNRLRIGTAMYPLRWLSLFGDLEYEKYSNHPQLQPGFYLGVQLTRYGPLPLLSFMPRYGMLPLYIGFSHEPFDRETNTQMEYFSIGAGYCIDNIYVQWALRTTLGAQDKRTMVLGSGGNTIKLTDASYVAPLFISIGYRF